TKIAWNEVSPETIRRCWFRTKVVSSHDENGVPVAPHAIVESIDDVKENPSPDPNDELTVKELQQQIDVLPVRNPLSIEDLLNLEEEQEAHHQFTDEDLIQAAMEVKQVEEEFIMPTLTGEEQLNILHGALRIVDERINDGGVTIKSLHKLQSCIREKVRKEKAGKQVQCRLDQYFT
ncbi:29133_t:CDS:1, partial [Racocetra persica]